MPNLKRVTDIMTKNPITVIDDTNLQEACKILDNNTFRHLPVVDRQGHILGILSDRDIRSIAVTLELLNSAYEVESDKHQTVVVNEVMTMSPQLIQEDTTVLEAAQIIINEKVGALPVVNTLEEKTLVGILSYVDILKFYVMNSSNLPNTIF